MSGPISRNYSMKAIISAFELVTTNRLNNKVKICSIYLKLHNSIISRQFFYLLYPCVYSAFLSFVTRKKNHSISTFTNFPQSIQYHSIHITLLTVFCTNIITEYLVFLRTKLKNTILILSPILTTTECQKIVAIMLDTLN